MQGYDDWHLAVRGDPDHQQAGNGTVHLKEPLLSGSTGAFVIIDFRASKAVALS